MVQNNTIEIWEKWIPNNNLAKKYCISNIEHNNKLGFKVRLLESQSSQKMIEIVFADSVWFYRYTDESFRQDTVAYLRANYGSKFYANWTFFKIKKSKYLKWISNESYGMYDDMDWQHFCILTDHEILDIVANYEPEIKTFRGDI